jgi:hypothetical protein
VVASYSIPNLGGTPGRVSNRPVDIGRTRKSFRLDASSELNCRGRHDSRKPVWPAIVWSLSTPARGRPHLGVPARLGVVSSVRRGPSSRQTELVRVALSRPWASRSIPTGAPINGVLAYVVVPDAAGPQSHPARTRPRRCRLTVSSRPGDGALRLRGQIGGSNGAPSYIDNLCGPQYWPEFRCSSRGDRRSARPA